MATKPTSKKKTPAPAETVEQTPVVIHSIKGFDKNLVCNPTGGKPFQFEIGKTYTLDGPIKACQTGFHACTTDAHPFEVFGYYAPGKSRFFEVTQSGKTHSDDGIKIASATITIGIELTIGDLVKRAWDYVWSRATKSPDAHTEVDYAAASATGTRGAASATGYQGAASATGYRGAASATGTRGAAVSSYSGRVMGAVGNALFAIERDGNLDIVSVAAGIVGLDGIEPNVWYVARDGKLVVA